MGTKRTLSKDDAQVWRRLVQTVSPLRAEMPEDVVFSEALPPTSNAKTKTPAVQVRTDVVPVSPVSKNFDILSHGHTPGLDYRTSRRLSRGKLAIDRRIDLHGLSQTQAYDALTRFVSSAAADGCRCVLVITGKGAQGRGVLRAEVPHWLNSASLRPMVLGFDHARPSDGGEGALYVLLRRSRNSKGTR